ncbi:MAG: methyl-accepting chemotaxis protein [bacterium]
MSDSKKRRKLINLDIKRRMQIRLIIKILVVIFACIIVSSLIFYIYSNRAVDQNWRSFHVKLKNMKELLIPIIFLAGIMSTAIAVIISLFYPGPLVGPLYRIEKVVGLMTEGDLTQRIKLRQFDEYSELASLINFLLESQTEKILQLKKFSDKLKVLADKGDKQELLAEIGLLKEGLDWFKVRDEVGRGLDLEVRKFWVS